MFSFQFHNLPPLNKRCYMLSSDSLKAYWVVSNSISGIISLSIDWKISLISLARYASSGQSDAENDSSSWYGIGFGFKLMIIILWKRLHILFTDMVLPFIRHRDLNQGKKKSWQIRLKIMVNYAYILLLSRLCPSFTGLPVCAREECRATAERKLTLHVDLVFSDAAATSEP